MRCACMLAGMVILGGVMTFAQAASAAQSSKSAGRRQVVTPPGYAFTPNFNEYFPPESKQADEQGLVRVRVCYGTKGRIQSSEIEESSGFERLDQAAIRASRDILVKPGTINGIPQADCVVIPVTFSLLGKGAHSVPSASGKKGSEAPGQQNKVPSAELTYMPDISGIYPFKSRQKGEEGTVVVVVCYNAKGKVVSSELYSSSGFERLDKAAVRAGRNFRLEPASVNGVPQAGCGAVPLKFSRDR